MKDFHVWALIGAFCLIGFTAGAFIVTAAIEKSCNTFAQFKGLDGKIYHCHHYVDFRFYRPKVK